MKFRGRLTVGEIIAGSVVIVCSTFVVWGTLSNIAVELILTLQPPLDQAVPTNLDLAAQRGMNLAAWWMVILTGISAVVGLVGVLLILASLNEARRSSDAAVEAVRTSQIAVRAFLVVDFAKATIENSGALRLRFGYRNSGVSPATEVALRARLKLRKYEEEEPFFEDVETKARSDVSPGGYPKRAKARFYVGEIAALKADEAPFVLEAEITIEYLDVFERLQKAHAKYGRIVTLDDLVREELTLYRDVGRGIGWGD